jgi:hypothetical protein
MNFLFEISGTFIAARFNLLTFLRQRGLPFFS